MPIVVDRLWVHPVKGMTAQSLDTVALDPVSGVPGDRRFAIALGRMTFDPARPTWLRKEACAMLARNPELARLRADFDPARRTLTLWRGPRDLVCDDPTTSAGRARLEVVLNQLLGTRPDGAVRLVEAGPQSFTDVPQNGVSILHLASVREFAAKIGRPVEPERFRANVWIDGETPWEDFTWLGGSIRMGAARLRIVRRIDRCAATHVNPATADRDLSVVKLLKEHYGHVDLAVFAEVEQAGTVRVGDPVAPPDGAGQGKLRADVGFYAGALTTIVKDRFRR